MEKKEIICIICPRGCHLELIKGNENNISYKVKGAQCRKGIRYGIEEMKNPTRFVASTVKISGGIHAVLPVRTSKEIPKEKIFDCMKLINTLELEAPVKAGQVISKNILGLDVDIITSRGMDKITKIEKGIKYGG